MEADGPGVSVNLPDYSHETSPLEPGQSKGLLGPQAGGKKIRVFIQPTVAVSHRQQLQSLTAPQW